MMTDDLKKDFPWLNSEEYVRWNQYERMEDEAVLAILRRQAESLGHLPAKYEIPDAAYFKQRFGPWPRVLEKAGLKPVSPVKIRRMEAVRKKRNTSRMRIREYKGAQEDDTAVMRSDR